jgi:hypothetical protein
MMPADLLVATDDRIDLSLPRRLGEITAVLLEGLVLLFGVVARDAVRATHLPQRVEYRVVLDAEARSVSPTPPGTSVIARRTCSVDKYSSPRLARSPSAFSRTRYVDAPS